MVKQTAGRNQLGEFAPEFAQLCIRWCLQHGVLPLPKSVTPARIAENAEDIWKLVQETGFLPLFRNEIKGFSIEECTPSRLWLSDTEPGPWE